MEKVIRINESTLVKIIKKIISENDSSGDDKKIKLIKIALKYLTKRFKGNPISKEMYVDALKKMNFIEFSRSLKLFKFFNQHVKEGDWDNLDYSKLVKDDSVKDGLYNFISQKMDREDVLEISGSGNADYIENGYNNFPMEVEIQYRYMGEKYTAYFEVDASFHYSVDAGDYITPQADLVEEEEIDISSSKIVVYDEEGDEYFVDLDKQYTTALEGILLSNFEPLEGKIELYYYG